MEEFSTDGLISLLAGRQRKEHTGIEEKCTTAIKVDVLVATTVMYLQIE